MNTVMRVATAFAAGAAAMYYLDPLVGRRRRALVRDKGVAAGHDIEQFARAKTKRAADKLQGAVAETRAALSSAPVSEAQLRERIRSRLGRLVEAPGDVAVDVRGGNVVLRGHATAAEIDEVIDRISLMRGVNSVESHLVASEAMQGQGFAQMDGTARTQSTSPSTTPPPAG